MAEQKFPILTNPPIKVAIFEIRFKNESQVFPPSLEEFNNYFKSLFPIVQNNINKNIEINDLPNGETSFNITGQEINQIRYFSSDKTKVLSLSKDGFILNINNSYESWEDHISLFRSLWGQYSASVLKNDYSLLRASTRFINHFEILNLENPADYFKTTIYADENVIPAPVNSFLFKYNTVLNGEDIQIHVVQGFEPPIDNKTIYMFDIDVISIKNFSETELWSKFDRLRELKNQTFFNNLTDKAINSLL
ncbi:TIGR04255 family protein [Pedobacter arcticus]|uniref:TIGR04255 family protein n=1 Tax=Pedobacter arcticus TaxID=752140 RepID=UPI0002F4F71E|nr:TIGR04255 family protein [Pedobacter arcticus]